MGRPEPKSGEGAKRTREEGRRRPGQTGRWPAGAGTSSRPQGRSKADRIYFVLLFLAISAALARAFAIDKHLSADGVYYFATILERRGFAHVDWTRGFAEYLIQWPLVLAVSTRLTHVPALVAVFSVGIYLVYLATFTLCLYAVRREGTATLALPILAMATVNLPADYILAGEHQVMALLASPILLMILRRATPTWWDGLCLSLMLIVFARTYPTAVAPALLFAVLLAVRLIAEHNDRRAALIRGAALLLSLAGLAISAVAILQPRDTTNRDFFRSSLGVVLHPEILFPAAAAVFFMLGLSSERRLWRQSCAVLSVGSLLVYARFAFANELGLTAHQSFAARTLTVTVLLPLLLLTVVVHRRCTTLGTGAKVLLAAILLLVVQANIRHSAHWERYRDQMQRLLATATGFIPVEKTRLFTNPCRWGWTSPYLSVVWSYPLVRAIVENPRTEAWQPSDPRRTFILERYVRYDQALRPQLQSHDQGPNPLIRIPGAQGLP